MKQIIRDILAKLLAKVLRRFAFDPRYFLLWEAHGYHVQKVHFYNVIPDMRTLTEKDYYRRFSMKGVSLDLEKQVLLLDGMASRYAAECKVYQNNERKFRFGNTSLEAVDAELYYCFIREFKPRRVCEIGSGYSTLVALDALQMNIEEGKEGEIRCIEPFPPSFLTGHLSPSALINKPVQEVDIEWFETLQEDDILFIDSSHVCKIGSDVQYEYLEILPHLSAGVIVHVHDIFFPFDYPKEWITKGHRFWNEQYLLHAFLTNNSKVEILMAAACLHHSMPEKLSQAFSSYDSSRCLPASFWFRII